MALIPAYKIEYEGKDVTLDFSNILTSITFTDSLEGKAGSLVLEFADSERNFMGSWFPTTEDVIRVWLGNEGEPLLDAQQFWVDEVNLSGSRSGNKCVIRAMSTAPSNIAQGAERKASGTSLAELAAEVSSSLKLRLKGNLKGVVFGNQTKNDLSFLMQQCKRNGYILKVENGNLVAYEYANLRNGMGVKISLNDVIDWDYTGKAEGRFSRCVVRWYDVKKKTSYSGSASANAKGGAVATLWEEVESNDAASQRAKTWLEDRAKKEVEINISMVGNVRLLAGVAVELSDAGKISGRYVISEAVHAISRGEGYRTQIKLQK